MELKRYGNKNTLGLCLCGISVFVLWFYYNTLEYGPKHHKIVNNVFVNVSRNSMKDDCPFKFASYYQNNMVLQMSPSRSVIWGYGKIGAGVVICLKKDRYNAKVIKGPALINSTKCGVWSVTLKPYPSKSMYDIFAIQDDSGKLSLAEITNVIFGDVWVCGGQSNMEFTMTMVMNASEELKDSTSYKQIRVFKTGNIASDTLLYDLRAIELPWSYPTPETLGGNGTFTYFSAVCWLYGKYLYKKLGVPIGLVESCWGGTPVEAWSSPQSLKHCNLDKAYAELPENVQHGPFGNSILWNSMIHPLTYMTIKGVIWYQGESNTMYHIDNYYCSFPTMISQWRNNWYQGTNGQTDKILPFGFVQIADHVIPDDDGTFPQIRWHQTADYGYVPNPAMPNTFMAVAIDLTDQSSPYHPIHPRNKQGVALRLVAGSLSVAYNRTTISNGPFPEKVTVDDNHTVTVHYPPSQKLVVNYGLDFQVCCQISKCSVLDQPNDANWMNVSIKSYTDHEIKLDGGICSTIFQSQVSALRYAWSISPCKYKKCTVYNKHGFPAPLFIMDVQKTKKTTGFN